jgi:hypothetical protein
MLDRKALRLCFFGCYSNFTLFVTKLWQSTFICVCYVVTMQSAVIQPGWTGPEITGLCSSLFSKPNLQNLTLYEGQIKCHKWFFIFITLKLGPLLDKILAM